MLWIFHKTKLPSLFEATDFLKPLVGVVAEQPHPHLFVVVSGSHLYGFPSSDSDYDLRGVHILPVQAVIALDPPQETIELTTIRDDREIDLVTYDIRQFFALLLKRNGHVLEQLYSPLVVHTTPAHGELKTIAQDCITRHHAYHYVGFAASQWRLFEHHTPHRLKPLLYMYRVLLSGIHLMQTGQIEANLATLNQVFQLSYLADLMAQKIEGHEQIALADANLDFHRQEYQRLYHWLETASQASDLPDTPTAKPALNDLLVRLRLEPYQPGLSQTE